ncbi:VanW family protein [Haloimpatiens sp. FM7315]|uniref:VanW family protein n=1 Tax=Haloimpatiens sp. FM7315 TaxID=3298609 RepID=UPI0035A3AA0C
MERKEFMSRRETKRRTKKSIKEKVFMVVGIIAIVTVIAALSVRHYIYSYCEKYDFLIYPGAKVGSVDISLKTKEEAIDLLNEKYGKVMLNKDVVIKTPSKEYKINYKQLNAKYNILEVVNDAFAYGKDKTILEKYKLIKKSEGNDYDLKFNYDGKYIDVLLQQVKNDVNKDSKDAKITKVGGTTFDVTQSTEGKALNIDKLKKDINDNINGEINKDSVAINAEIDVVKPKVSSEELKKVNAQISSFSTKFNNSSSSQNRAYNILLASKAIDKVLLMPGETFSFNGVVGERSKAKGYKEAPVIIGNKVESGLGGGVCQVSTTLYNAVLKANMASVERSHHTLPSHYVDKGLDATVSYGSLDYKFKNTLKYPVYLESYVKGDTLYCSVYSNSELTSEKYDLVSEVTETVEPKTTYVTDSSLPKGTQVIDVQAKSGYRVNVYKVTTKNGQQISKTLLYKDYYKPVNGVIKKGAN